MSSSITGYGKYRSQKWYHEDFWLWSLGTTRKKFWIKTEQNSNFYFKTCCNPFWHTSQFYDVFFFKTDKEIAINKKKCPRPLFCSEFRRTGNECEKTWEQKKISGTKAFIDKECKRIKICTGIKWVCCSGSCGFEIPNLSCNPKISIWNIPKSSSF